MCHSLGVVDMASPGHAWDALGHEAFVASSGVDEGRKNKIKLDVCISLHGWSLRLCILAELDGVLCMLPQIKPAESNRVNLDRFPSLVCDLRIAGPMLSCSPYPEGCASRPKAEYPSLVCRNRDESAALPHAIQTLSDIGLD